MTHKHNKIQLLKRELYSNSYVLYDNLGKLSRTFEIGIKRLPTDIVKRPLPLNIVMSTFYAGCRLIDTWEDATVLDNATKKEMISLTLDLLSTNPVEREKYERYFSQSDDLLWNGNLDEQSKTSLMLEEEIIKAHNELGNTNIRDIINHYENIIGSGMVKYLDIDIKTLEDVKNYSYYVAGAVGEAIDNLILAYGYIKSSNIDRDNSYPKDKSSDYSQPAKVGIGLQAVNIALDSSTDNKAFDVKTLRDSDGNITLDSVNSLLNILYEYAPAALDYILKLPKKPKGIREFVALPYMWALASANMLTNNEEALHERLRITKREKLKVYYATLASIWNNNIFSSYFNREHKKLADNLGLLTG